MRCTERPVRARLSLAGLSIAGLSLAGLSLLGGCSRPTHPVPAISASTPAGAPVVQAPATPAAPAAPPAPPAAPPPPPPPKPALPLPPPGPVRSLDELRRQAAQRLVAANPHGTYLGPVHEPLLAIPVLEVELHRDGSVARIVVLRAPRQAKDTVGLAIAAVRRAAPFGDVSRLPRPWRYTETFLFDDARRFKPRSLDE